MTGIESDVSCFTRLIRGQGQHRILKDIFDFTLGPYITLITEIQNNCFNSRILVTVPEIQYGVTVGTFLSSGVVFEHATFKSQDQLPYHLLILICSGEQSQQENSSFLYMMLLDTLISFEINKVSLPYIPILLC